MDKPLISIIIPMFNAENYIHHNLESILNQDYSNFEVIIVNDGSTDSSLNIIKSFNDNRIKIYNKINEGTSIARNYGIKHAKGEYLFFIDADDYIEQATLSKYTNIINDYNPDLIINGFYSGTQNYSSEVLFYMDDKYYKNKKEIKDNLVILYKNNLLYNVWNKLFKKDIVIENNIRFKDINFGEDMIFVQDYLKHCNNVYNLKDCFYHYIREVKNSITTRFIPNLFNIRLNENKLLSNYFGSYGIKKDKYIDFISIRFIDRTLGCLENLHRKNYLSFKDKYKETSNIIHNKDTIYYLDYYHTDSKIKKIALLTYKFKSPLFAFVLGYLFHLFKSSSPKLFNVIKNKK